MIFSKRIKRITIISENVNNDYSLPENINKEYLTDRYLGVYNLDENKYIEIIIKNFKSINDYYKMTDFPL